MTQETEVSIGQVVTFSSGAYSDYCVHSLCRVLKPINAEVWQQMVAACRGDNGKYFENGKAIPWFVVHGYVEEFEYTELHLGDYGDNPTWENA